MKSGEQALTKNNRKSIEIDGNFCIFDEMMWNIDKIAYCPICLKKIKREDIIYLVLNNYKLFPNRVIHKSCVETDLETTTKQIIELYKKHKETVKNIDKGW